LTTPSPDDRRLAGRLAVAFGALLAAIVGLMTLGALVRAHEAGLACPDWPLCFGELVPRMDLKVAFEWSHRLLAGSISLVFVALAAVIWRRPALAGLRGHLVATAAVLGVQILLGALTVWHLLASWTVTSHLVTGNAFAVAVLFTTLRLREVASPGRRPAPAPPRARALLAAAAVLLGLQIVLGGLVSSTFAGLACPEWPTCNGGEWFPAWRGSVGVHLLHRSNAYAVWALLGATALAARGTPGLGAGTTALFGVASLQVVVGVANVLLGLPVEVTGAHSLLAALLVLGTAAALRHAFRAHDRVAADGRAA
jgi:cytochrome c oxidase assembly protein subunit 15